jgi:hypothetical protein
MGYWQDRPEVVKIFNDLDLYRDFCRYNGFTFNENDLYKKESRAWKAFENRNNYKRSFRNKFNKRRN